MKIFNRFIIAAFALLSLLLVGCTHEEETMSRAVLASAPMLTYDGENPEAQIITIYADADWVVEGPEWITVSPASGSRTMDVTISVTANMRDGALDNPRKADLIFKGSTLASQAIVKVNQTGDKYRDIPNYTISEAVALADESVVIVPAATVAAVTTKGYILTDGTSNIFAEDAANKVALGDEVSFRAEKLTVMGLPVFKTVEYFEVKSNTAVVYPEPKDITALIDTYTAATREYVMVTGSLKGTKVTVADATFAANILDATIDLAALNGHNVELRGYFAGVAEPIINIMAAEVKDLGLPEGAQKLYFSDDFEWVKPWADAYGTVDAVGNNDIDSFVPNVYTHATHKEGGVEGYPAFVTEFANRGYIDLNPGAKVMYTCAYYLKFGKTGNNTGIALPAIDFGSAPVDVLVRFNWACHRRVKSGADETDPVNVVVEVVDANQQSVFVSEELVTTQPLGKMEWQNAEVTVPKVTSDMRIVIRPANMTPDSKAVNRWYIDNIEVLSAGAVVESEPVLLFYDQFNSLTEGTGNANKTKIKDYTISYTGDGSEGVTYTAGNNVDFRNTYKQGSGDYVDYENTLWPDLKSTPGLHLYPGTGTYDAAESWFQMNDIKVLGSKTIAFGMGMFGVGEKDQYAARTEVATPLPVLYKFDNQSEWTKLVDAKFNYNWTWVVMPEIKVPAGAKTISFRFEPLNSNYVRVDDVTVVGK